MTALVEIAHRIARQAFAHEVDQAGIPAIAHAERVALTVRRLPPGIAEPREEYVAAALLHDVLEDTPLTAEALEHAGITPRVVEAVEALSRQEGESYARFITRAAENDIALVVKAADVMDNLTRELPTDPERRKAAREMRNTRYPRALYYLAGVDLRLVSAVMSATAGRMGVPS